MKILITGGTGFVGTELTSRLTREGHEITILTRSLKGAKGSSPGISYLEGDPTKKGPWQEAIKDHDAVINLAGASIFSKWTEEHKKAIRESRVNTTRHIVEGIPSRPERPFTLFSASAVGYYGFCGDVELVEDSPPGNDFLARIAKEWEGEALKAKDKGARVVITRFGIVMGEKGGALSRIIPLFKKYIGGPIGSGKQWFSWVHIKDLAEAFAFLLKHQELSGPVNVCSPNPVRNKDLAKGLGKALHRPSFFPAPGFMVKWALGEFGSVILEGQRVIPRRLLESDFVFQYPDIDKTLQSIVGR
ncbi:MAG: TIGR01777 family protein [Deltaproteobacteria bacterium RBG_16_49_23]|nr:MAG: TIGR01777 family protein [Deltaproteobacteria bacterium RBG_16_49_23]